MILQSNLYYWTLCNKITPAMLRRWTVSSIASLIQSFLTMFNAEQVIQILETVVYCYARWYRMNARIKSICNLIEDPIYLHRRADLNLFIVREFLITCIEVKSYDNDRAIFFHSTSSIYIRGQATFRRRTMFTISYNRIVV